MPSNLPARRLLLIKLGAIGDCVMAIPAAHAMHAAGYEIDWVCGQAVAPILCLYPWINVHAVDDRALLRGSAFQKARALFTFWRLVSRARYDLCATLYYDRRYKLLALPVRAVRKLMLSQTERATRLLPGRHHTDEYARILLGRKDDETPTQLAPVAARGLPESPLAPVAARSRIVLVPGGARNMMRDEALRRWPVTSYVQLAELLLARGHEVVLSGGPEDAWVSPSFAHLPVTNLIGMLSLTQSLALFDNAAVTVTHDTGPLHLAGITRSAIVTIFGPTDPHGRLPHRSNCVALWGGEGFACRPCHDGRNYAPCTNNGCVQQITPAMVLDQTASLLTAAHEGRALPPRVLTPSSLAPTSLAVDIGPSSTLVTPDAALRRAAPTSRGLFLDRDGTVNHEVGYLYRPEDVRWVDGILPLCRAAMALGYKLVVVTNQSGIARGMYTQAQFDSLTDWMRAELLRAQVTLDAVYSCPYHPEHGIGDYKREHEDRKPSPGMLLRAAADFSLDLSQSIMVGDRCSDIAAAAAAGLRQAFLLRGTEQSACSAPHVAVESLAEVEAWLRANS